MREKKLCEMDEPYSKVRRCSRDKCTDIMDKRPILLPEEIGAVVSFTGVFLWATKI